MPAVPVDLEKNIKNVVENYSIAIIQLFNK